MSIFYLALAQLAVTHKACVCIAQSLALDIVIPSLRSPIRLRCVMHRALQRLPRKGKEKALTLVILILIIVQVHRRTQPWVHFAAPPALVDRRACCFHTAVRHILWMCVCV